MIEDSSRFALPLLQPGQAQKETTHNEALTRLDLIVQATAVAMDVNVPPTAPLPGQCWIVGTDPTGAWADHPGTLAGWTIAGWRFVAPRDGMAVAVNDAGSAGTLTARYRAGHWTLGAVAATRLVVEGKPVVGPQRPAIPGPAGGTMVDGEGRRAIAEILETLREHGLIGR